MAEEKTLSTTQFFRELPHTKDIGEFFDHYEDQFETEPFHEYLQRLCSERDLLPADIIKKSDIERTFGHHIFNGDKNPSRDKVLQLAFGFEMNCAEARELLKKARKCMLSPRVKRDAVVMFALERNAGIAEIQTALSELGLPVLGEGKDHD
jgi:hypothetical protein